MKIRSSVLFVALGLLGMLALITLLKRTNSQDNKVVKESPGQSNFRDRKFEARPAIESNDLSTTHARIASQTLTEMGKLVVVEINGRLWTNLIPDTMLSLTDEQLLELAEALAEPPPPRSTPATDDLNKRLLFYGVTLDDQTNLLPAVTITGLVTVAHYGGELRHLPVATESGLDGRFEFDIADGQVLMLMAGKGTNFIPPPAQWFQYSPMGGNRPLHRPSVAAPVPFVLARKQEPEPLLELRRGWTARNTGEPVRIDLLTGQVVPTGGDIIVSIHCPEPYKAGDKIPWKLVLEATGGGLVPVQAERLDYMLQAPAAGYQEFVVEHAKDGLDWAPRFDGLFYLKARDGGLYAKLRFDMHTRWDERGIPFGFHALVNTNGSRNLQMPPK